MAQYLAEELLDSEGEPVKKTRAAVKKRPHARKSNKKVKHNITPADDADSSDDSDFTSGSSETESDSPVDNEPLTNAEVCSATMCYQLRSVLIFFVQLADVLPTKSVPQTGRQSKKRKLDKRRTVVMEEVEDRDSPQRLSARSQSPLDPSTILEEAPTAVLHSSAGEGNKKTTKVITFTCIISIC
jgi:hypothetical protein